MKKSRRIQHRKKKYTRKQKGGSESNSSEPYPIVNNFSQPNVNVESRVRENKAAANKLAANAKKNKPLFDCSAEGFDIEMREAAFGKGYTISVGGVHENAEQWPYDETARRLLGGMVDWYRRILEARKIITPYTKDELAALNENQVLKDLAVFYNRYKIVAEKTPRAKSLFNCGIRSIYTNIFPDGTFNGPESFDTLLKSVKQNGSSFTVNVYEDKIKLQPSIKNSLEILASFKDIDFSAKDLPIEIAIDRAQCIIFYLVKHKGQLPPGFVMDERISKRAHQEVLKGTPPNILTGSYFPPRAKLVGLQKWLSFLNEAYDELNDPPVSFGLRWE